MKKKYNKTLKWKRRMHIFLGLCYRCGKETGGYFLCYKCREDKRRLNKRVCKIDGCFNIPPKGSQFCDIHSSFRSNINSCSVSFNICKYCGNLFTAKRKTNYRCSKCWVPEMKNKKCAYHLCGKEFKTSNSRKTTCSHSCSIKLSDYLAKQKRRAERSSSDRFIERVEISVLFKRDKGRCIFCNKKLKLSTHFLNSKAPTIDHIIPLSKGGEHSYKNTQLSCRKCNLIKGNRTVEGGEQLLLFGT